jgi:glutamyl-tRNA synthetase
MTVRTRFAPSPTGFLHIGGVRTALFNWLLARHHGGQFLLRIDDTDQQRHVAEAVGLILDGFRWIGMDWDEGPEVGGPHAPYFQSQRADRYTRAAAALVASGHAYRDYSTEAERAAEKAVAERAKVAYRFRGTPPTAEQIARFEAEGRPFALRFQVPLGRTLVLHDLIKGDVAQKTDEIGDFVIVRPDGSPLYNFASAVDDAEMRITHVVRAEEHLSNTFPQLLVFEALGADLPAFAHVPYVAAPGSKKKLSKRDGAVGLDEYIRLGYLPEAMMNYLARLGWSYDASQEIFSRAELIEKFALERVNSAPASHDPDKLYWIEGEWMKTLPLEQKVVGVIPFLAAEGLVSEPIDPPTRRRIEELIKALGDRLKVFSDILKLGKKFFAKDVSAGAADLTVKVVFKAHGTFVPPPLHALQVPQVEFKAEGSFVPTPPGKMGGSEDRVVTLEYDLDAVKKRLRKPGVPAMLAQLNEVLGQVEPFDAPTLETAIHDYAEVHGQSMGNVVNPLRVATTGEPVGPGLYECLENLGREVCRRRVAATLEALEDA